VAWGLLEVGSTVALLFGASGYWGHVGAAEGFTLGLTAVLGVFGVVTAIGLFMRSRWALVAIRVVALVWILYGAYFTVAVAMNRPFWGSFVMPAIVIGLGISWLKFFGSERAKEAFSAKGWGEGAKPENGDREIGE
jgi:hypothetical protein